MSYADHGPRCAGFRVDSRGSGAIVECTRRASVQAPDRQHYCAHHHPALLPNRVRRLLHRRRRETAAALARAHGTTVDALFAVDAPAPIALAVLSTLELNILESLIARDFKPRNDGEVKRMASILGKLARSVAPWRTGRKMGRPFKNSNAA